MYSGQSGSKGGLAFQVVLHIKLKKTDVGPHRMDHQTKQC